MLNIQVKYGFTIFGTFHGDEGHKMEKTNYNFHAHLTFFNFGLQRRSVLEQFKKESGPKMQKMWQLLHLKASIWTLKGVKEETKKKTILKENYILD